MGVSVEQEQNNWVDVTVEEGEALLHHVVGGEESQGGTANAPWQHATSAIDRYRPVTCTGSRNVVVRKLKSPQWKTATINQK